MASRETEQAAQPTAGAYSKISQSSSIVMTSTDDVGAGVAAAAVLVAFCVALVCEVATGEKMDGAAAGSAGAKMVSSGGTTPTVDAEAGGLAPAMPFSRMLLSNRSFVSATGGSQKLR